MKYLIQEYHNSLNDFYQLLGLVIISDNTVPLDLYANLALS